MPEHAELIAMFKQLARYNARMHRDNVLANEKRDEIMVYITEEHITEFVCNFGTVSEKTIGPMCGKHFDRAAFEAAFPEVEAEKYGITFCNDPHLCRLKPGPTIEGYLDEEGFTEQQMATAKECLDFHEAEDHIVIKAKDPTDEDDPEGWPDDEIE